MKLRIIPEKALLNAARRFNLKALEAIYDRYSPGLYRYAMRLLGDIQQAEDCVSEVFSRFLKMLQAEQGPDDHLQAYLYRMAHNWITDQYRRQPATPLDLDGKEYHDPETSTEKMAGVRMEQANVREAIKALTPEQRQVIMLRYYEGWELDEVARSLNKEIGAIKALQHRAVDALRKLLIPLEETA